MRIMKIERKEEVYVCPRCGSTDVSYDYSIKWRNATALFLMRCNKCGFVAQIFPTKTKKNNSENI